MNIRVDLNYPIKDGTEVVFRSPVDCSQVTGLKVYYGNASQEFVFADAHGNNVGDIDHLFAENAVVKVILDVTTGMAFVQNADTNAYLEGRFSELEKAIGTGGGSVPPTDEIVQAVIDALPVYDGSYTEIVDSPLPTEIATEEEMAELLDTAEVGSVYKYTGETTDTYENGGLYIVSEE